MMVALSSCKKYGPESSSYHRYLFEFFKLISDGIVLTIFVILLELWYFGSMFSLILFVKLMLYKLRKRSVDILSFSSEDNWARTHLQILVFAMAKYFVCESSWLFTTRRYQSTYSLRYHYSQYIKLLYWIYLFSITFINIIKRESK